MKQERRRHMMCQVWHVSFEQAEKREKGRHPIPTAPIILRLENIGSRHTDHEEKLPSQRVQKPVFSPFKSEMQSIRRRVQYDRTAQEQSRAAHQRKNNGKQEQKKDIDGKNVEEPGLLPE